LAVAVAVRVKLPPALAALVVVALVVEPVQQLEQQVKQTRVAVEVVAGNQTTLALVVRVLLLFVTIIHILLLQQLVIQ
jgi:hypothetical protein